MTEQLRDHPLRESLANEVHALVERRIEELREARLEGLQTLEEFVERRLAPAMRTCISVLVICLAVWYIIRRISRRIMKQAGTAD